MKVEFVREIGPLKVESSMEEYFLANEDIYLGRYKFITVLMIINLILFYVWEASLKKNQ